MDKNYKELIFKILKIVISLLLCVGAAVSMLGAVALNVARDYLQSEPFKTQVTETDLATVKFSVAGQTVTVNEYVKKTITEYLEENMPYASYFAGVAVEKVVSSQIVNDAVKGEVFDLVDFYLNSDAKAAKERLKDGEDLAEKDFDIKSAKTVEEAVKMCAHTFIIANIEKTIKMPSDRVIVLLSEQTVTKLIIISCVLLILLIAVNFRTPFNSLLWGAGSSLILGIAIKIVQGKFESMNEGTTDLVGYVFLKPLADTYSANAMGAFIAAAVLIAVFVAIAFAFNKLNKPQE